MFEFTQWPINGRRMEVPADWSFYIQMIMENADLLVN